jgi:uroporphyrinogen-III synthase
MISEESYKFRVLSFRAIEEEEATIELFEKYGFEGLNIPLINIITLEDEKTVNSIKKINDYDIIIFSSAHAFYSTMKLLEIAGVEFETEGKEIACIGEKTAKKVMEFLGIDNVIIGSNYSADSLGEYFSNRNIENKKFLLPISNLSLEVLKPIIESKGGIIDKVVVYRNEKPTTEECVELRYKIKLFSPNCLLFTSPSTFNNFLSVFGEKSPIILTYCYISAIGDVTKKVIENNGNVVHLVPSVSTLECLLSELREQIN